MKSIREYFARHRWCAARVAGAFVAAFAVVSGGIIIIGRAFGHV